MLKALFNKQKKPLKTETDDISLENYVLQQYERGLLGINRNICMTS